MKNGIVSPVGVSVMATAMVLGGLLAPLFTFLFAAFVTGAIRARFEDWRRHALPIPDGGRHRAF